jgi:hypothetical protein
MQGSAPGWGEVHSQLNPGETGIKSRLHSQSKDTTMLSRKTLYLTALCLSVGLLADIGSGQPATGPEDAIIDPISGLTTISEQDQRRIAEWVQAKIDSLRALPEADRPGQFKAFRTVIRTRFESDGNTEPFKAELATQTAAVAASEYGKPNTDATVARVLAQALVDMDRPETIPGLMAGLESARPVARLLCASGLAARRDALVADPQRLESAVRALREAGLKETQPVVLARIYLALAYPNQVGVVFSSYLALFDKRLAQRRGTAVVADGAEIDAYQFFQTPGALAALSPDEKAQLARRLAVFLRLDAVRYNHADLMSPDDATTPDLRFYERDAVERMLVANEAILFTLVGRGPEGAIAEELRTGGFTRRGAILAIAYEWVGNPETKEGGILNEAPWNVDIGAP